MARRKGEITTREIDERWPYQVATPSANISEPHFSDVLAFLAGKDHSPRGFCFVRDDAYWNVTCFAVEADALAFAARFGGEIIDPRDRPKWPG